MHAMSFTVGSRVYAKVDFRTGRLVPEMREIRGGMLGRPCCYLVWGPSDCLRLL